MKFRVGTIVAALLCVVAVSARGGELTPWRYGVLEAKSDSSFSWMITQGFAEKQGLKLEMSQFTNDGIGLRALVAGTLDSYDSALNGTLVAASHGADIKLIGCHWPGMPFNVFAAHDITTPQDLKGKTFAISSPFAAPDVLARLFLQKYDVPATALHFANLGSDLDRYKSVLAGVAQATVVSEEYTPVAEKAGIRLLARGVDVAPEWLRLCLFTTGKAIATRRAEVIRFAAAEITALRYAETHRDAALALARKMTGDKPDDPRPAYIYDQIVENHMIDPALSLPMDKIQWMNDLLVKQGNLAKPFDLAKFIDPDIRVKALALAGPDANH